MFPFNATILVVDDMPAIRELVKGYLRQLGYREIFDASDGRQALDWVHQRLESASPIDLIISDWNMPQMDGLSLLKSIRSDARTQQVAFIMLTSETEKDKVLEAISSGVDHFIIKPFEKKTLEEKLKIVWQKKQASMA